MNWVRAVGREVAGLFVDDARFAIAILVWLLLAGIALPRLPIGGAWAGLVLFAGLAFILVESAIRRSRR